MIISEKKEEISCEYNITQLKCYNHYHINMITFHNLFFIKSNNYCFMIYIDFIFNMLHSDKIDMYYHLAQREKMLNLISLDKRYLNLDLFSTQENLLNQIQKQLSIPQNIENDFTEWISNYDFTNLYKKIKSYTGL